MTVNLTTKRLLLFDIPAIAIALFFVVGCQSETYKKAYEEAIEDGKDDAAAKVYAKIYEEEYARARRAGMDNSLIEANVRAYAIVYVNAIAKGMDESAAKTYVKKYMDAIQAAAKIRQLEESNADQLAISRALVDSGEFVAAYKILEGLPDSLLLEHEMENVIELGLRQAITERDIKSADALLVPFLMRTQDSSYVQAVKALKTYSNVTKQLNKMYRDTASVAQEFRDLASSSRPMRGYIVQKMSDYLYECRYLEGGYNIGSDLRWVPERPSRRMFLLQTVTTVFSSKGSFSLYVIDGGTRSVKMTSGFTEKVQVLIEDTEAARRNRLREKKRQLWREMNKEIPILEKTKSESYEKLLRATQALELSLE